MKTQPNALSQVIARAFPALLTIACIASAEAQSIGAIQGTSHLSPLANTDIAGLVGIVTARDNNGFWIQDSGDGNALTSDAIYVFRGSTGSKAAVGDSVQVSGRILEFRPGGDVANLTLTEVNATATFAGGWTLLSAGNALPAPVTLSAGFLPPTAIGFNGGNVETAAGYVLRPNLYAIDFYEALEGMRVRLPSAVSSGPTNTANGETALISLSQVGIAGTLTSPRGGVVIGPTQFNGHRILIDNRIVASPTVNSGARIDNITGVFDYSFGNYKLLLTEPATVVSNALARESVTIAPGRFGIASYNVENLGGNAAASRFTAIAGQIAGTLGAPHLISLQEIQDNDGAANSGTVTANLTLDKLKTELNSATGRSYQWVSVNPANNTDGGQPGGNIRQAFMYDTARVSFAGVVGGALDAVTAVAGAGGQIQLNLGAGRVDPGNAAWVNSRKPLVTEFAVDGQQIIVVANHFNSKGGDEPLFGPHQPAVRSTEVQRLRQAQVLGSFVQGLLAINPHANIVVTGDFNDFQFADSLAPLAAAGLVNMTNSLPENERYTYAFEGNLQTLDHMWVSANLLAGGDLLYDVVHANAEFSSQVSDHDPILLTFGAIPAAVPEPQTLALLLAGLVAIARRVSRAKGVD